MERRKVEKGANALVINTASISEVAICYNNEVQSLSSTKPSAESLTDLVNQLKFDFREVDTIYFICGPGSYTGLRVGLAYAQGIALSLDKPLIFVSSMLALSLNVEVSEQDNIEIALRATKNDFYYSKFSIKRNSKSLPLLFPLEKTSILLDTSKVNYVYESVELNYDSFFKKILRYQELDDVSSYNHYASTEIVYVKPVPAKTLLERNISIDLE